MAHSIYRIAGSLIAVAATFAACSGTPPEPKDPNSIESIMSTPTSAPTSTPDAPAKDAIGEGRLNETQKDAMEEVLKRGTRQVENCDETAPGCMPGEAEVQIVFDGQKGKITDVLVTGPPFAGTPCEPCIKNSFKEAILPFDGEPIIVAQKIKITVSKTAAPADKDKKKKP